MEKMTQLKAVEFVLNNAEITLPDDVREVGFYQDIT